MTTNFKIFAEIEYHDVDEFEVYKKLNDLLHENGFKFRRATITEKDKTNTYMHGNGM